MQASRQAAVTPAGIRDGDPSALAALVERRANAVLAYCEAVLHAPQAVAAAAEAFARFRAAVVGIGDPEAVDPEVLLLGATRHAAAAFVPPPPAAPAVPGLRGRLARGAVKPEVEAQIPALLAARLQAELGEADLQRLTRHLSRSASSRQLEAAFARAETAYQRPPERTVPIAALSEIMSALAAAAPIVAADDDITWGPIDFGDQLDELLPAGAAPATGAAPPEAEAPASQPGAVEPEPDPAPAAEADPELIATPAAEGPPAAGEAPAHDDPQATAVAPAVGDDPQATAVLPAVGVAAGTALPRPERRHLHLPHPDADSAVYRWVLPGGAVVLALVAVLGVSGVFSSGSDPAPARGSGSIPAAPPSDSPPVTEDATAAQAAQDAAQAAAQRRAAAAVRRRKARVRAAARERRAQEAAAAAAAAAEQEQQGTTGQTDTTQTSGSTTTPPAATTTAALPTPAPSADAGSSRAGRGSSSGSTRTSATPAPSRAEKNDPSDGTASLPGSGDATATTTDPVFTPTP